MIHVRFGLSLLHPMGQLTNIRSSDGAPDPDGAIKAAARIKIRHCRNLYLNRPDPIAFLPMAMDTTGHLYDDFIRLLFLHLHREASALANELPEESECFRFLRASCFANLPDGCCWLDYGESIGYACRNPPGPFISAFHTASSFYMFASPHTVSDSFPRTFSSVSCLSGTC